MDEHGHAEDVRLFVVLGVPEGMEALQDPVPSPKHELKRAVLTRHRSEEVVDGGHVDGPVHPREEGRPGP